MSFFRLLATYLVFGKFYTKVIWIGSPEEFVLEEVVPWALLTFEHHNGQKWEKVQTPEWAVPQIWDKVEKERLR